MEGYQHQPAFDSGLLEVGAIHKVHYAQYGKADGKAVIFLHGGPGGETSPENAAFFNPSVFRVVLMDQRGCGKSIPHGEIKENTSQHLAADVEALRIHLGIRKWHMVFGGSWGSSLALIYAQSYPESVGSLVLRGVFTCRQLELQYVYSATGPRMFYPQEFARFVHYLPQEDRDNPTEAYHKLLLSDDPAVYQPAAREWNRWELSISKVAVPSSDFDQLTDDAWNLSHARMELHYFTNGCFLKEGQLLHEANIAKIQHIPCTIVQGRLDLICPAKTAVALHDRMPNSRLYIIPAAGHSAKEPGMFEKLVEVCDEYGEQSFT